MKCNLLRVISAFAAMFMLTVCAEGVFDAESNIFTYTFSNGSVIQSTSELNEEEDIQYLWLSWSDDVEAVLMQGEETVDFVKGNILSEDGDYALYAYCGTETVQFNFSVTSGITIIDERFSPEYENGVFTDDGITTNVLDGEIIAFPAVIECSDNYICSASKNGDDVSIGSSMTFSDDGTYSLIFTDITGAKVYRLSFQIWQKPCSKIDIYSTPIGFSITKATLDEIEIAYGKNLFMKNDGVYEITYSDGNISRTVNITRDTKPPVLMFNGSENLTYSEAVKITADGEYSYTITKENMSCDFADMTLSGAGIYRINAEDEAGNVSSYRVVIEARSGINPVSIILIVSAVIIAAVLYFVYHRTHPLKVK